MRLAETSRHAAVLEAFTRITGRARGFSGDGTDVASKAKADPPQIACRSVDLSYLDEPLVRA